MLKVVNIVPSLQTTLKSDSILCAVSGIVLVLARQPIANLLAPDAPELFGLTLANQLDILGVGLLVAAIAIYAVASKHPNSHVAVWAIIFLEAVWIIDSAILLFLDDYMLTIAGRWLIAISAIAVLVFMLLEIYGLKNLLLERSGERS